MTSTLSCSDIRAPFGQSDIPAARGRRVWGVAERSSRIGQTVRRRLQHLPLMIEMIGIGRNIVTPLPIQEFDRIDDVAARR
jgi:hypothetical protein